MSTKSLKSKKPELPAKAPIPFKERKVVQIVPVQAVTPPSKTPARKDKKEKRKTSSKCGDCEGFTRSSLVEQGKVCNQLGRITFSEACPKFKPDVFRLQEMAKKNPWTLKDFSAIVADTPNHCLGVLAEMLKNERITRKYGFTFYQKVYYHWGGGDNYLSNFASAYILDVRAKRIRLLSWKGSTTLTIDIPRDVRDMQKYLQGQVYTVEEYRPLKREMIKANRRIDKVWKAKLQAKIDANLNENLFNGSIPTIDDFVGEELRRDASVKRGKKKIKDLVDIFHSTSDELSRKKSSVVIEEKGQSINIGNTRRVR